MGQNKIIGDDELKPCPFCGGRAYLSEIDDPEEDGDVCQVIQCTGCLASSPIYCDREETLINSWNFRVSAEWRPIEAAPKTGETILAWCNHAADPYALENGARLTPYGANAEGMARADDGVNTVYWHDEIDEGEYVIPAWWCVADETGEIAANPTHWMPLPEPPNGQCGSADTLY